MLEAIERMPWVPSMWLRDVVNEGGLLRERVQRRLPYEKARLLGSAVNGDTSYSEWEFDATYKGAGRVKLTQVAARRWKNGQIVHERFYYHKG